MYVEIAEHFGVWSVRPLEGRFYGQAIALVEGASLSNARATGGTIQGELNASWGVTMLSDLDAATSVGLVGRRTFNYRGLSPVTKHFGKAQRLIVRGNELMGR